MSFKLIICLWEGIYHCCLNRTSCKTLFYLCGRWKTYKAVTCSLRKKITAAGKVITWSEWNWFWIWFEWDKLSWYISLSSSNNKHYFQDWQPHHWNISCMLLCCSLLLDSELFGSHSPDASTTKSSVVCCFGYSLIDIECHCHSWCLQFSWCNTVDIQCSVSVV